LFGGRAMPRWPKLQRTCRRNSTSHIAGAELNSLWQTATLAFLIWFAIRLFGAHWNGATRHVIWWIALIATVILPCIRWRAQPASVNRAHVQTQRPAPAFPIPVATPLAPPAEPASITVTRQQTAMWPWLLLAIWCAVFLARAARVVRSYFRLRGIKRRATPWNRPLPCLTRRTSLLISSEVSSPIAVGFLHPAVIVPGNVARRAVTRLVNIGMGHLAKL
jgi:beta-lactamase regulating signal transducer with metallopeptidase domain